MEADLLQRMARRRDVIADAVATYGTPSFVYFADDVASRIAGLREVFEARFAVSFAVKSNPNPALLRWLRGRVETLDVSSSGELQTALDCGWPAQRLTFTGPAKRSAELRFAVGVSVGAVVVESLLEARVLSSEAEERGLSQRILVRVAPARVPKGFGVNMSGRPTQFGIDEEDLEPVLAEIAELPGLRLEGFHCYSGTQCLDPFALADNFSIFCDLFARMATTSGIKAKTLIFGTGFGIPYHAGTRSIDLEELREAMVPIVERLQQDPALAGATPVLETGRFLVGEAGVYVTRVLYKKHSRGAVIGICDGGMNHHLGACGHLGSVIHRNYPIFKVASSSPDGEVRPYELVGPLCTTIDTLGHGVELPGLDVNDLIGIACSGAYGPTASPSGFISHPPACELWVEDSDSGPTVRDISQHVASRGNEEQING